MLARSAVALVLALGACSGATTVPSAPSATPVASAASASPAAVADLACRAPASPTPEQTEGPFFKAGSPEKASLVEPGLSGTRVVVSGRVLTRSCAPLAQALVDVWQADDAGQYDNAGFRLRGHVFADAAGRYRVETIVPGLYTGRTRHIHVKVTTGSRTLTTQLYFPDERANSSDSIFSPALLVQLDRAAAPWSARFDFVLDLP